MPEINYMKLPFDEAIKFFRQKVNLPTQTWKDIWEGMHARAFVIAGAMKSELLADFKTAVDKAISQGTTLQEFRKDFDQIVEKHGWSYKGSRGWRTSVIYNTNLRTAFAAGRFEQMKDPAVQKAFPYWRYQTKDDSRVRPLHRSWHGITLRSDDPWWQTHYPPNGWGCRCEIVVVSSREYEKIPDNKKTAPDDGTYKWTNKNTGETIKVPNGINPGWAYNVGEAAWGQKLSDDAMNAWKKQGAAAWDRLTPGDWKSEGRPEKIPIDKPVASLGKKVTAAELEANITTVLGGSEKTFSFIDKKFRYDIAVNAKTLASHIEVDRSQYLPFLPETITKPYEIWMSFEKHKETGMVVLKQRIIKAISTGKKEGMLVVTNAVNGRLEAWTFIPVEQLNYLNKQRVGSLVWKR